MQAASITLPICAVLYCLCPLPPPPPDDARRHDPVLWRRQICLHMGFRRDNPWLYLSGDNPELLDVYPELGYLRDIVYLLKAFMAPTSDALPEVGGLDDGW